MSLCSRVFPRLDTDLSIGYEFVKWNFKDLGPIKNPVLTGCQDISASGIGLQHVPDISHSLEKKLISGKMKMKISLRLYQEYDPLFIFARLVWLNRGGDSNSKVRSGLMFIDIDHNSFEMIKRYVEEHLAALDTA
jgi:hypothetical protein